MTLKEAFDAAKPRLEAALARSDGLYAIADIEALVMEERGQLWHGPEFSGVTEVINYPQKRVVVVHLAGGSLPGLKAAIKAGGDLDKFARIVGASAIMINGRRGWVRALAEDGYREVSVQVIKGL